MMWFFTRRTTLLFSCSVDAQTTARRFCATATEKTIQDDEAHQQQQQQKISSPKYSTRGDACAAVMSHLLACVVGEEDGMLPRTHLSPMKQDALAARYPPTRTSDSAAADAELVQAFVTYIRFTFHGRRHSDNLEELQRGWHLSRVEKECVLHHVAEMARRRSTSLVVATRVVRHEWPPFLMEEKRSMKRYIAEILLAWISDELRNDTLSPKDARAVLENTNFVLRGAPVGLVAGLARKCIEDADGITQPESLVSLMWSIHVSGAHAPDEFWRRVVLRLTTLNRIGSSSLLHDSSSLTSSSSPSDHHNDDGGGVAEHNTTAPTKTSRRVRGQHVGHLFSGLSTRQIYRILEVLKRERWCGDRSALHELAQQGIQNVAMEVEARTDAYTTENASMASMPLQSSRRLVRTRLAEVADLEPAQLVDLLAIAVDLGVCVRAMSRSVERHLLVPLVQHLDAVSRMSLLRVLRHCGTECVEVMDALLRSCVERGTSSAYVLPMMQGLLAMSTNDATKQHGRDLIMTKMVDEAVVDDASERLMRHYVPFYLRLVRQLHTKVRPSEVCRMGDVLHILHRRKDVKEEMLLEMRHTMDLLCRHMNRLMQLGVVGSEMASRLLELTILMGMRKTLDVFPHTADLIATRQVIAAAEHLDVSILHPSSSTPTSASSSSPTSSSCGSVREVSSRAVRIYNELIYMFERMSVVRSEVGDVEMRRFDQSLDEAGLVDLLCGMQLMERSHFGMDPPSTLSTTKKKKMDVALVMLQSYPRWMEKRITTNIHRRLSAHRWSDVSDAVMLSMLGRPTMDAAVLAELHAVMQSQLVQHALVRGDLRACAADVARRIDAVNHKKE